MSDNNSILLKSKLRQTEFTLVGGIPWLFNNPDYYLLYWQSKANELLNSYNYKVLSLENQKSFSKYPHRTERLNKLIKAFEYNQKKMEELLSPLFSKSAEKISSFTDMIPSQQTLSLYWDNVFRDWAWETNENQVTIENFKDFVGANHNFQDVLILGTGSSRFALDFHSQANVNNTFALDFNPLLLFVAQKMLSFQDLKFYEITSSSIEQQNICQSWLLKNPIKKEQIRTDHFHLLFGDILNLPFKEKSFNTILTPWVIDILPMEFEKTTERINQLLPENGDWINFGPLGFMHANEGFCHTKEEIEEILINKGFSIEKMAIKKTNYLNSPISSQKRSEDLLFFHAKKKTETSQTDFTYLPNWLINRDLPIPLNENIRKQQILAKTHADVFFSIDNHQTFNSLSALLANHYKMSIEQSQQTLMLLFIKFHESHFRSLR